jgi:hypothetical protein
LLGYFNFGLAMSHELKGQKTWIDLSLQDLRHINDEFALDAPCIILAGETVEAALSIVHLTFGFSSVDIDDVEFITPVGSLKILKNLLLHIVEKRDDARERYVHFALITIQNPFEVWRTAYLANNGDKFTRLVFIGLFSGKKQMLVTVDIRDQMILWNFMHLDKKSLNKHRHGEIIYHRE